jgi:hypothetical protein
MSKESQMEAIRQQIFIRMRVKETKELLDIWRKRGNDEWTELAIDVVQGILVERLGKIPSDAEIDSSGMLNDLVEEQKQKKTRKPRFVFGWFVLCAFLGLMNGGDKSWASGHPFGIILSIFTFGMPLLALVVFILEIRKKKQLGLWHILPAGGLLILVLLFFQTIFYFYRRPSEGVLTEMAKVCKGQGVSQAAVFVTGKGPYKIVVLDENGKSNDLTNSLPISWRPSEIRSTQLIACVGEEQKVNIETCTYYRENTNIRASNVLRSWHVRDIVVFEAKTGEVIKRDKINGDLPHLCNPIEPFTSYEEKKVAKDLTGSYVAGSDLVAWLNTNIQNLR